MSFKTVYLDIGDVKHYDKHGRVLAVVYIGKINVNAELIKKRICGSIVYSSIGFNHYS